MSKVSFLILMGLMSLAIAAVIKEDKDPKKDKRGLIDLGYGYAYTPDYVYPQKEVVFNVPAAPAVTVEKHFQVPAPIPVYNSYHQLVQKSVPVQPLYSQPLVRVPDTINVPYANRYSYSTVYKPLTHPIYID